MNFKPRNSGILIVYWTGGDSMTTYGSTSLTHGYYWSTKPLHEKLTWFRKRGDKRLKPLGSVILRDIGNYNYLVVFLMHKDLGGYSFHMYNLYIAPGKDIPKEVKKLLKKVT